MAELVCRVCSEKYGDTERVWKCRCGGLLDIVFNPGFPLEKIRGRKQGMWRYREAIPINDDSHVISFDEGFTPLIEIEIFGRPVSIKQDHLFPTGSYKDRGASVLISKIHELGVSSVVEDSSGNAGCSVAAYCARAGISCEIFVPAQTSPAKLRQITAYGAHLHEIPGSREDTAGAVLKAARSTYYASHSWNPYFFHGTKTFAFEITEQLGWEPPGTIILPVGNGTLLLGAAIGFDELRAAGVIKTIPRIIGIQTENCAPLYRAFHENGLELPVLESKPTIAEGIAIAAPVRGLQIIEAVERSGGDFLTVCDSEISLMKEEMGKKGFYIEPTAGAAIAGVKKYLQTRDKKSIKEEKKLVSVFTGHGLKSVSREMK